MAVAFVDASGTAYDADMVPSSGPTTSFVVPVPAAVGPLVAGDFLIANISVDTANVTPTSPTLPSGWASLTGQLMMGSGTTTVQQEVIYHFVTAGEAGTSPSWVYTPDGATAREGNIQVSRWRGVDTVTPFAVASPFYASASVTTGAKIAPSVTTTVANAMLVAGSGLRNGSLVFTDTTPGYTSLTHGATGQGRTVVQAYKPLPTAGASGAATFNWATTSNGGISWQTALNPSTGTGTPSTAPTVGAGADSSVVVNTAFTRTAGETDGGAAITSRAWTIFSGPAGAGTTIGTAAALSWTPTTTGSYVLRYTATNSVGSSSDDVTVTVTSAAAPTLVSRVVGIPTGASVPVAVRTTLATSVRLQVSPSATFASGIISGSAVIPNAQGDSQLTVTGLAAGTAYYTRIGMTVSGSETFSAISSKPFKTAPSGPASFAFDFSSCCDAPDSAAMSAIAARNDDLFFHLGDLYYADGSGTTLANFRSRMAAKITAANHAAVFSTTPTTYTPSDHDGLSNDSNAGLDATAWTNWNAAYRELWPTPALPGSTGAYFTFTWGRVRFIQIDRRSFATTPSATDGAAKTCLGITQKQWLKDTITAAAEPVIIILQADPWIGAASAGDDAWAGYTTERTELANFFAASSKSIGMLAGDMHALAADSGTNAPGGIFVFHASPLNNSSSQKGGPYTAGPYPASGSTVVEQYGRCVVTDTGSEISLAFTGYSADNTARITLTETVATTAPTAKVVDVWNGSALIRRQVERWNGSALVPQIIAP